MRALALVVAALVLSSVTAGATTIKTLNTLRGAEVWFVEDHTVPVIALEVSLPAGSAYDPSNKPGLADFAASMLDEGAGGMDSKTFHEALVDRAIQLSVTVDRDYFDISLVTLTENAPEAFRLLGLALQHPRFDADAIARVRAQILQSIASEEEDPENVATKVFYRTYFGNHPYAHATDGESAGVDAVSQNDLRAFAHTHWVRGGLKVVLSGDLTPAKATTFVTSTFAKLGGGLPAAPSRFARSTVAGTHIIDMPLPQPTVVFGLPGVLRNDPDFIPAYVANYIVGGGGFSSRLTTEVRVKRGLTYDISSDLDTLRSAGLFVGEVGTRKESVNQSISVVKETLRKFADEGATDQELVDAKTYLSGSFPLSFASNSGIAAQLGIFQREGLPPDYVAKRNDQIEAVTADDIRRVAKRLFNSDRLLVVVAGTPAPSPPSKKH